MVTALLVASMTAVAQPVRGVSPHSTTSIPYGLERSLGVAGLVLAKILLLLAAFGLALAPGLKRGSLPVLGPLLALAVLASSQRFFVRPELLTLLFLPLYVWLLHRWLEAAAGPAGRAIWLLPFLQVVWTNSHTLFILGPLLVGLAATVVLVQHRRRGKDRPATVRTAACLLLACAAACCVNPYGLEGVALPFQLFAQIRGTVFKHAIGETMSPLAYDLGSPVLMAWLALLGACVGSALMNLRRMSWFLAGCVLAMGYLSFLAIRNLPLFALVAVPFVLENLRELRIGSLERWLPPLGAIAGLVTLLVCSALCWQLATDRFAVAKGDTNQFGLGLAQQRYPEALTEFLSTHTVPGPVFNTLAEGSYLLAHQVEVFVDPRLEVYAQEHFARYLRLLKDEDAWQGAQRQLGFQSAVVDIGIGLINRLLADPRWALVHFDTVAALFVRRDAMHGLCELEGDALAVHCRALFASLPQPTAWDEAGLLQRVSAPQPFLRVAELLMALRRPRLAEPFLECAARAAPPIFRPRIAERQMQLDGMEDAAAGPLQRADQLAAAGNVAAAVALVRSLLSEDAEHVTAWALLGRLLADQRDFTGATAALREALRLDPGQLETRKGLGRVMLASGDAVGARAVFEAAQRLAPTDPGLDLDLAWVCLQLNDLTAARQHVERGLQRAPGHPQLLQMQRRLAAQRP